MSSHAARRLGVAGGIAALLYTIWAGLFIAGSSAVVDGKRYFSLLDDAMISMRYAWHLAQGHGLVWNAGERVEGYTNFLMTLGMTIPHFFLERRFAVLSVQIAGIGFVLGTALMSARIARDLTDRADETGGRWAAGLTAALTALYYPLSYWSLLGMETGLMTLLVTAAIALALSARAARPPRFWAGYGVLLGLINLSRPEAVLVSGAIAVFLWSRLRSEVGSARAARLLVPALAVAGGITAAHLGFRLVYYGEWVPNTAVLKLSGMPTAVRLGNGWRFLLPFFLQAKLLLLLVALATWRRRQPERLFLIGLFLIFVFYQISVGGDPWAYWRLLVPTMPALFAVAVTDLLALLRGVARAPAFSAGIGTAALVATLNQPFWPEIFLVPNAYVTNNRANVETALVLDRVLTPRASVGVLWAGTLPYYLAPRIAVDFLGKSDKRIARLPAEWQSGLGWNGMTSVPGHNKYDLRYSILERQPTFIETYTWLTQSVYEEALALYVRGRLGEHELMLRRESPEVDWAKLDAVHPL